MKKIIKKTFSPKDDLDDLSGYLQYLFKNNKIKNVLLVTPPDADSNIFRYETALRGRYTNYPPYGLGLIAQKLGALGVNVEICNLNHEILKAAKNAGSKEKFNHDKIWQEKLDQVIGAFNPDIVGVTCMFTMTHISLKRTCGYLSQKNLPVAIGGVHVSNDVERVLDDIPGVSFAFLKEAETAFYNLIGFLNGQSGFEELGQMIVVQPSNKHAKITRYYFNKDIPPTIEDYNLHPRYDLMNIREYAKNGVIGAFYCFKPTDAIFATVLSNRGCRGSCTFCSVRNFNGKGVRTRDPIKVVDEIELLVNDYGVEHFMWLDDDLLKDHNRAIKMFDEISKRNLNVTWDATNGLIASSCTDEVVDAMAKSGCIAVNIGMESGNPGILREIRKPGTVDIFIKAAEVLRKYHEIHTSVLLMIGFPGETLRMAQDTIDVAKQMDCDWYRISPLQPLPNTPIHEAMIEQGLIQDVKAGEVRFMGGSYGKQAEIEKGQRSSSFKLFESFEKMRPDDQLNPDQITDLWFYMNYTLNFHRIFYEKRKIKLQQLKAHLTTLSEVISPENGFALYFLGFLQSLESGAIEQSLVHRFEKRLSESEYWRERLEAFGLTAKDLIDVNFNIKDAPTLNNIEF